MRTAVYAGRILGSFHLPSPLPPHPLPPIRMPHVMLQNVWYLESGLRLDTS